MYNPNGFDPSYLNIDPNLGDPRRQESLPGSFATQGQAVSAPYAEANMRAAANTNPMNAVSQEPGKDFLQSYLQKSGQETDQTAFDLNMLNPFNLGKIFEAKDKAERGEDPGVTSGTMLGRRLNYQQQLRQAQEQSRGIR